LETINFIIILLEDIYFSNWPSYGVLFSFDLYTFEKTSVSISLLATRFE